MEKLRINLGSKVLVENLGRQFCFEIVESGQADPTNGRISNESPIGRALLGHGRKEKVIVKLINGETISYRITRVY